MEQSALTASLAATQEIDAIYKQLNAYEKGLSEDEASKRLRTNGLNVFVEEKRRHWMLDFLTNFKDPLVLILLFASIASFIFGEVLNALIIAIIIFFSTILNFVQEFQASKAAQKLREKIATLTSVIRNGKEIEVKSSHICVGDILVLNAGDIIPADARIIASKDFFINQSSLTGESFPAEKHADVITKEGASLAEMTNCIYAGSSVISGTATAVVFQIGKQTEFGKIADSVVFPSTQSEFTLGIKNFSLFIMRITIFFVLFVFLFTLFFKNFQPFDSFTFAIAIAVGLTPELLPMIMSVTMARGSLRMAKHGVIVKKLAAIPDFGEMNILCTDKTGTLTEDNIELVTYTNIAGNHSETVLLHAYLNSYFQTGIKNPLDDAVIRFKHEDIKHYKKIDEIPFDFERKKMSVIAEKGHERIIITKGSPEEIIKVCHTYDIDGEVKKVTLGAHKKIVKQYNDLSKEGYRVLGVATRRLQSRNTTRYTKDEEKDLTFIGFIAFLDPAKKDAKEVLLDLEKIGIEVKVITGDNELVTQKICKEVALPVKGVLLGNEVASMTNDALRRAVEKNTIFARCSPEQKNRILHALKENGHVVGYMGDGINDAPSLKTADVGISVNNAVDVAKEAADMILTHKSLQQLKEGVKEGRKTFGNTMKYVMMGISSNFGNMFSVLGAIFYIPFLPMLPIQILLNNLLYDFSQITIPSDNVDEEYLQRPKKWDLAFIKKFMIIFGSISSFFDLLTFYIMHSVLHLSVHAFQTGWFLESLLTQTLVIHSIRTRHIPIFQSRSSFYLLGSTILISLTGLMLPYTVLGRYFSFEPLAARYVLMIGGIVLAYIVTVELVKHVFYARNVQ
jgi:Mg2+-importing ATPase